MARTPVLLVVDDEPIVGAVLARLAEPAGFDVTRCSSAAEAMQELDRRHADIAFVDLRMPDTDGLQLLRQIRLSHPACEVVLMSGYGTMDIAVEAVKLGARDCLSKPLDFPRVNGLLRDVRDETARRQRLLEIESRVAHDLEFHGMLGRGAAMQELFSLIRRLAPHVRTVLITGETGTGKELVAQALHKQGPRRARPFITVNCSAVVETLFESELFGHVRGAFTGATEQKRGLFEAADGGTLFLDEIGELPLVLQAKLLRVLEDGAIHRVGSSDVHRVNACVFAATNRDLEREVAEGRFRSDLLYRLNAVELALPPLRERPEDIPYLTSAFVTDCVRRFGKTLLGVTPAAERMLSGRSWDGNVRELRNTIERACMLAEGSHLTDRDVVNQGEARAHRQTRAELTGEARDAADRAALVDAMQSAGGNKQAAAQSLGISRRALYRRLERHGLHTASPLPPHS
ncbi:MAG: sigma-54 dependent transcriptional regulator [Acidobacteriota bacterium]|nr:sigma-54 dependent transcriptional regulator [Acidobacteriota bacterium]